ncbi:MAG: hypothetical protein Q9216_002068 [Gyalolechia sp. 2 TL-2023]
MSHAWTMPQYHLRISLNSVLRPYRFGSWTILQAVEEAARIRFEPVSGSGYWQGQFKSGIHLETFIEESAGAVTTVEAEEVPLTTDDPIPPSVGDLEARHELEIIPLFGQEWLPKKMIFLPIMEVMVSADEAGPNAFCPGISRPSFVLNPVRDPQTGVPLLKWGQLSKMMRVLARWIVAQRIIFAEMEFTIKRDGVTIAIGRIRKVRAEGIAATA